VAGPLDVDALRREWVGRHRPTVEARVELGTARALARALGESSPVLFDEAAARAAGFPAVPTVPGLVFVLGQWAAARQPAATGPGERDDITALLDLLAGADGMALHAEQAFRYERPVLVGDTLRGTETVVDVDRAGTDHPLWLVRTRTEWTDLAGALVVTADKTVAVRQPHRSVPGGAASVRSAPSRAGPGPSAS
jgi:acyl dehydratase